MAAVIIIVGVAVFLTAKSNNINKTATNLSNKLISTSVQTQIQTNQQKLENITVTGDGFFPANITISKGSQVVWLNKSGKIVSVNSDVYPANLLWSFLNLGDFDNGQNVSVIFQNTGTYTYHNQFNPDQKGTVVVK